MGVAEGDQAVARDHRHHGVGTPAAAVHPGHGGEHGLIVQGVVGDLLLELVGQHVEQHFGVGAGIDVAQVLAEQLQLQLVRVGEVAVVGQDDAEGGVHVERLGLGGRGRTPGGGIAHVGDAHVAEQVAHVPGAEHIPHQAVVLVHVEGVVFRRADARGVLPAVLEHLHPVIQQLVHGALRHHPQDSAHSSLPVES